MEEKYWRISALSLMILASLLGSCAAPRAATDASPLPAESTTSTPVLDDLDQARATLIAYLSALNEGRYAEAAQLYGGSYELLHEYNPGVAPSDKAGLLEGACTANGFVCARVHAIVDAEARSPTEFVFTVELEENGKVFVFTPPPGAEGQSRSRFPFTVVKADDTFLVLDLPPYVS